jgi:hypothetical protein
MRAAYKVACIDSRMLIRNGGANAHKKPERAR